ncbi:MAG: acylphosphatase [Chloroflexota bacterium]|nr:acylphosphatase [Chloroflexota bacterium]
MSKETGEKAVHIIVHGDVQGVGFRYFTLRTAQALRLVGWVKNRSDGAVEIWAEGPERLLKQLLSAVRAGPDGGFVSHVDVQWTAPTTKFRNFLIRYL